jgi:hypothetical protein
LRPTRPEWSDALSSELEHISDDHQALIWAAGCIGASYKERYCSGLRYFVVAAAVGIAYELLDEAITGIVAAQAWPRWYIPFARLHRHLSLELWEILASVLPSTLEAAGFGLLLARLTPRTSITLPCLSLGVYFTCLYGSGIYWVVVTCSNPLRVLWESWALLPASSATSVILPVCAMLLAFHIGIRNGAAKKTPR